jgi:hypothetical protein
MTGTHYEKTSKYAKGAKSLGLASTDHNDTSERRGRLSRVSEECYHHIAHQGQTLVAINTITFVNLKHEAWSIVSQIARSIEETFVQIKCSVYLSMDNGRDNCQPSIHARFLRCVDIKLTYPER